MNKVDAYSKLFDIKDHRLDVNYYLRLMSKSDGVPEEVIEFFEEYDRGESSEEILLEDSSDNEDDTHLIVEEFIDHIKDKVFYRRIRNSTDPNQLAIATSSFVTHYLIELHNSSYDEESVIEAMSRRIDISDILNRLSIYLSEGNLEELAVAVVLIREFLDKE